jgi:hypothetical protein
VPFPQTPLQVFIDIAPGASPAGSVDSWDPFWVDVTNDVRVAQGVVIDEGIPDEAFQADPGTCSLTVNNGSSKVPSTLGLTGCYSPRNATGPYWGKLLRNTPLRVRMQRISDTFTRVTASGSWGVSDNGVTWSGTSSALSTDGSRALVTLAAANTVASSTANGAGAFDFDMTGTVQVNAVSSGGDWVHQVAFRRNATSGNQYVFQMDWSPTAVNLFLNRIIGSTTVVASLVGPSYTANTDYKFRLKADGAFVGAKFWLGSGSEPAAWTISSTAEGGYNLDNTALGGSLQLTCTRLTGNVGTTVGTWDNVVANAPMFVGTVPEWPVRWDKSGNDSTVPIKAAGVLRRLQAGANPVKSPLYSYLDQFGPTGLWALEDSSGATVAASQTSGAAPAYIFSTTPGGWSVPKLGGTASQYTVAVDTTISSTLPRSTPSGGWSFLFAFYMPVLPVTNPLIFRVRAGGTVAQWDVRASDDFGGVVYIVATTSDGTVVINTSTPFVPGRWNIAQVEVTQATGTTVTGRIVCYDLQTGAVGGATSGAITATMGSPNSWALYGSTGFQSGAAGPVVFYAKLSPVTTANLVAAGRGFAAETADARIARLCAERGVRLDLLTGTGSKLGVQSSDSLLNVLVEAATTDLGLLTEFHGGLRYRPRVRRYNQNARLALDFAQKHIADPPEPTDDDQRLVNDVTVSRKNGTQSVRAYDSANITSHGIYDTSLTINPYADSDLPSQASFRLYLGTWDELRWPTIAINLAANPALIASAVSLDPGALVTVANPPSNLPVGTLYLLVEAVKHTLTPFGWYLELTCSPYGPWRILDQIVTNARNRINIAGSTLTAGINSSVTSLSVTNTGSIWSAAAVPFDINLNGEAMTVTAITGTTVQAFTVTRGANTTTAKAHTAGETVNLDAIMYVAL